MLKGRRCIIDAAAPPSPSSRAEEHGIRTANCCSVFTAACSAVLSTNFLCPVRVVWRSRSVALRHGFLVTYGCRSVAVVLQRDRVSRTVHVVNRRMSARI